MVPKPALIQALLATLEPGCASSMRTGKVRAGSMSTRAPMRSDWPTFRSRWCSSNPVPNQHSRVATECLRCVRICQSLPGPPEPLGSPVRRIRNAVRIAHVAPVGDGPSHNQAFCQPNTTQACPRTWWTSLPMSSGTRRCLRRNGAVGELFTLVDPQTHAVSFLRFVAQWLRADNKRARLLSATVETVPSPRTSGSSTFCCHTGRTLKQCRCSRSAAAAFRRI